MAEDQPSLDPPQASELIPTPAPTSAPTLQPLRENMVSAARQFMSSPKVRGTSFDEQKNFLIEKGLTEEEISAASSSLVQSNNQGFSAQQQGQGPSMPYYGMHPPPEATFTGKLYGFTQSIVVIGGASYMAYKFVRSWVMPKFFNYPEEGDDRMDGIKSQISDLQNSTKFIIDSVDQTLQTVSKQQEQLSKTLNLLSQQATTRDADFRRLQTDVEIVKSLLLNTSQFPAPVFQQPINNGVQHKPTKKVSFQTPTLPAWQIEAVKENERPPPPAAAISTSPMSEDEFSEALS